MGLFPPGLGKYSAPHKGQQAAPQALLYWPILLVMGVRKPTVASPMCHQKPPGAYKPCIQTQQQATTLYRREQKADPAMTRAGREEPHMTPPIARTVRD